MHGYSRDVDSKVVLALRGSVFFLLYHHLERSAFMRVYTSALKSRVRIAKPKPSTFESVGRTNHLILRPPEKQLNKNTVEYGVPAIELLARTMWITECYSESLITARGEKIVGNLITITPKHERV